MVQGFAFKPFKIKAFVSWLTALSFVGMTVSGLVLFISPRGRYLRSHDWLVFGLDRAQWNDQHLVFSLVFVVAGIWHLWLNWSIFLGYLKRRLPGLRRFGLRPDWVLALLLSVWVLVGTIRLWPPFHWVPEAREWAKYVWERQPESSEDTTRMSPVDEWLSGGGGGGGGGRGYGGGQGR